MKDFRRNIGALTGLRGIAALWVASFHFAIAGADYQATDRFGLMNLIGHGYLAVDLFFAMSGFVMALSYGHYFASGLSWRQFGVFMIRRAARIYPLYLLVTALYVAQSIYHDGLAPRLAERKLELVANVLMVQSWGISSSIVDQGWSISTEFAAYILFPFIAAALLFAAPRYAVLCCALCAAGIVAVASAPDPSTYHRLGLLDVHTDHSGYAVLRCFCGFGLGIVTYRVAMRAHRRGYAIPPLGCYAIGAALVLSQMTPDWDLLSFAITPLFILAVLNDNAVARLLGSRLIVFLGEISYAVYMIHGKAFPEAHKLVQAPLLGLSAGVDQELAAYIVFLVMTIGAGALVHYLWERPARRYIRALETWFDPRAAQTVRASEAEGYSDIMPR